MDGLGMASAQLVPTEVGVRSRHRAVLATSERSLMGSHSAPSLAGP